VDYLERKDAENEAKIRRQEGEIIQIKAKVDVQLETINPSVPSHDELIPDLRSSNYNMMGSIHRKQDSSDDSSTRAVLPSSCRDLSLIGHSLNGLYLVQNLDTKKIETVFCNFGTSSKSI